ncbi:MAG: ATP phosphoribosyltransferase [Chloroflexi bacterium]|nr:ATP phosphoribosyltransferase [Chloroflexota bacterium]
MTSLKIALAKGRLLDDSIKLLESIGYDLRAVKETRKLVIDDGAHNVRYLLAKPMDVPIYVEYGAADVGIVGQDALRESGVNVYEPAVLGYGNCRLMVAGKPEYKTMEWRLLTGLRIATQYPRVAKQYFSARGLSAEIIEVYGSVELAPAVGLADLIVDVVDTGSTLKANGLIELDEIFRSQATLIVNRASHTLKVDEVRTLIEKIENVMRET